MLFMFTMLCSMDYCVIVSQFCCDRTPLVLGKNPSLGVTASIASSHCAGYQCLCAPHGDAIGFQGLQHLLHDTFQQDHNMTMSLRNFIWLRWVYIPVPLLRSSCRQWSCTRFPMASDQDCIVLNWIARGLNNPARRQVVSELV
jgi:hypothetical protein